MTRKKVCRFIIFYSLIVVTLLLMTVDVSKLSILIPYVEGEIKDLTNLQKTQLEIFVASINLLISLSTLIFGAVSALLFNIYKRLKRSQQLRLTVTCLLAGLSIYCGYLSHQAVLWMLGGPFFNLANTLVALPSQIQFVTFLASIVFVGDFIRVLLERK